MAESGYRGSAGGRDKRSRTDTDSPARRPRAQGASSDTLLEIADEIEEHARALLARARDLRRTAGGSTGSRERPAGRPQERGEKSDRTERTGGPAQRRGNERRPGERSREAREGGSERPKRNYNKTAPEWAPTPKRRKT
jgi:hypothetical protein